MKNSVLLGFFYIFALLYANLLPASQKSTDIVVLGKSGSGMSEIQKFDSGSIKQKKIEFFQEIIDLTTQCTIASKEESDRAATLPSLKEVLEGYSKIYSSQETDSKIQPLIEKIQEPSFGQDTHYTQTLFDLRINLVKKHDLHESELKRVPEVLSSKQQPTPLLKNVPATHKVDRTKEDNAVQNKKLKLVEDVRYMKHLISDLFSWNGLRGMPDSLSNLNSLMQSQYERFQALRMIGEAIEFVWPYNNIFNAQKEAIENGIDSISYDALEIMIQQCLDILPSSDDQILNNHKIDLCSGACEKVLEILDWYVETLSKKDVSNEQQGFFIFRAIFTVQEQLAYVAEKNISCDYHVKSIIKNYDLIVGKRTKKLIGHLKEERFPFEGSNQEIKDLIEAYFTSYGKDGTASIRIFEPQYQILMKALDERLKKEEVERKEQKEESDADFIRRIEDAQALQALLNQQWEQQQTESKRVEGENTKKGSSCTHVLNPFTYLTGAKAYCFMGMGLGVLAIIVFGAYKKYYATA